MVELRAKNYCQKVIPVHEKFLDVSVSWLKSGCSFNCYGIISTGTVVRIREHARVTKQNNNNNLKGLLIQLQALYELLLSL